MYIVISIY